MRFLLYLGKSIFKPIFFGALGTYLAVFLGVSATALRDGIQVSELGAGLIITIPALIVGAFNGLCLSILLFVFSKQVFEAEQDEDSYGLSMYLTAFIGSIVIAIALWYLMLSILPYADAGRYIDFIPLEQFAFLVVASVLVELYLAHQWIQDPKS